MGGGNDRLGLLVGLPDQALLDVRDAGKRGLDAQIPTGDHNAVGRRQNLGKIAQRGLGFDFGDHRCPAPAGCNSPLGGRHVVGRADKRQADIIDAPLNPKAQIGAVLFVEDRQPHQTRGAVDSLVGAQRSSDHDCTLNVVAADLSDLQLNLAVGQQQRIPGPDLLGQPGVGDRYRVPVADNGPGSQRKTPAGLQFDGASRKVADAHLGTGQVLENGQRPTGGLGQPAQTPDPSPMFIMAAVREVEPGDVHPGRQQGLELVRRVAGRPDGGHDLGFPVVEREHAAAISFGPVGSVPPGQDPAGVAVRS